MTNTALIYADKAPSAMAVPGRGSRCHQKAPRTAVTMRDVNGQASGRDSAVTG